MAKESLKYANVFEKEKEEEINTEKGVYLTFEYDGKEKQGKEKGGFMDVVGGWKVNLSVNGIYFLKLNGEAICWE